DIIRASGHAPRQKAGHMTAADQDDQNVKMHLANRGRPHMTDEGSRRKARCFGDNGSLPVHIV
ncbi:MAG: hypothetical protein ABSC25_25615, partial [Roseiarcus sp.]